jgi:hypothetical protein
MVTDQVATGFNLLPKTIESLKQPQHIPKFYIWAEKGSVGPSYIETDVDDIKAIYGDETFNTDGIFYNHSTAFLEKVIAEKNNCVVHRLYSPGDARPANITLSLDLKLVDALPMFVKNSDGTVAYNQDGLPTVSGVTKGYEVSWIATYSGGPAPVGNGSTVRYPIFEFAASGLGSGGNRIGVCLAPRLQSDATGYSASDMLATKNYPYVLSLIKTNMATGKTSLVANNYSSNEISFVLEKNKKDPNTDYVVDAGTAINEAYVKFFGDNNPNELGYFKVFDDNVTIVTKLLYDVESAVADPHRDPLINGAVGNEYCMNIISFTSSNGSPYKAIHLVDSPNSVRLSRNTIVRLKGGIDGVVTDEAFDSLVASDMDNYDDLTHEYMDLVLHPESHLYDTGFTYTTKKALGKFISKRKDTYVIGSSFAHDKQAVSEMSVDSQVSVAQSLELAYGLYPESTVFSTSTTRATVVVGSCLLLDNPYQKRLPVTIELAVKAARFMGDASGRWIPALSFSVYPNSVLSETYDVDTTWIPAEEQNKVWSSGLTFVTTSGLREKSFMPIRTVYSNSSSVLNSFFTVSAICFLNKIEHAAWREFSGDIKLNRYDFIDAVNKFVAKKTAGIFANLFIITPDCRITSEDVNRGYTWKLVVKIAAPDLKSVGSVTLESYKNVPATAL